MPKRTQRIVNRPFQLKTAFKIIGIMVLTSILFVSITGTYAILKNNEITKTAEDLQKAITVENDIIEAFIDYTRKNMDMDSQEILAFKKINEDHKKSMEVMNGNMAMLQGLSRELITLLIVIVIIVIFMCVATFFYLIRLTHRISGPLYLMEKHIDTILAGEQPEMRDLRKKDEFRRLYQKFRDLVSRLNQESIK